MGFWDNFVKVWEVRASIKIQESVEETFCVARENAEIQANIPKIINELNKKNKSWKEKLDQNRKKIE